MAVQLLTDKKGQCVTLRTEDLCQAKRWLNCEQGGSLLAIIEKSFSGIEPEAYFFKYFEATGPSQRKLRLYYDNTQLVGYCLLTFTQQDNFTVIRASAAFLPAYRNGNQTFPFALKESLLFWLRRPWHTTYYADTMLSPAMYRATAKNTAVIWPHPNHSAPSAVFERLNPNGKVCPTLSLRCLLHTNRSTQYSAESLKSFFNSMKQDIQFYCKINPDFNKGQALYVVIPITLGQVIKTLVKTLVNRFR